MGGQIGEEFGIPIVNHRVSVTPISLVAGRTRPEDFVRIAETLDKAADELGIDFIGGFSAQVEKGMTPSDTALIAAIPQALASTKRVCSSVNVGSTRAGLNMDAIAEMGRVIKQAAALTADHGSIGCAKLVVFCNAVEDNPFMAGAFHGVGEGDCVLHVGVSGPGVVLRAVEAAGGVDFGKLTATIRQTAFKITRAGELVGRTAAARLGIPFGIIDLSLAPTPAEGDSVARILEAIGVGQVGGHGSTAALAMLNDAVKKGGAMASSYVGGLSGAFIPVSEDIGMIEAAASGALTIDKLEAMTSVCSVGLDMIAVPGDTPAETLSAIIADEAAIGMINKKTTAVRIIPAAGKQVGDWVDFGGLLGRAPVMALHGASAERMIARGGPHPGAADGAGELGAAALHEGPGGRQIGPAEGEIAGPVRPIALEPVLGFLERRDMARLDPPQGEHGAIGAFEEVMLAGVDVAMNGLEHEPPQRFRALPNRHVDVHGRVARPVQIHGAGSGVVLQPPDEARHAFGQGVDAGEIVVEVRHTRIIRSAQHPPDVHLRQLLLHVASLTFDKTPILQAAQARSDEVF